MQVPNVLSGLTDAVGMTQRNDTTASAAALATKAAAAGTTPTDASTAALRDILARYDVTDISPNDYTKMVQSLYDQGAISKKDMDNLTQLRGALDAAGVDPDKSINLVDFYRQQIAATQSNSGNPSAATQQQISPMLNRLSWLEKFAIGHEHPESIGVNLVA
jgi:hypothetical protein